MHTGVDKIVNKRYDKNGQWYGGLMTENAHK